MTHQRRARVGVEPRPWVVVRARDPDLRAQILRRLRQDGDLDVTETGTEGPDAEAGPEAVVEVEEASDGVPALTPREQEVLALMAEGLANKEIAANLGISTHTAKFHVESVLRKLGAVNRAEAVHTGIRRGLIGI